VCGCAGEAEVSDLSTQKCSLSLSLSVSLSLSPSVSLSVSLSLYMYTCVYVRLSSQQQHYREGTRRKRRWCILSMSSCRNCIYNRHVIYILVLAEGDACSALVLAETVSIKYILPLLPKLPPPLPFTPPHAPRNRTFPKRLIGMP
jgi:hypothetical protein